MFSISNQNIIAVNVTSTTMSIFMKGFPFLPHGGRNDTKQLPLYILLHVWCFPVNISRMLINDSDYSVEFFKQQSFKHFLLLHPTSGQRCSKDVCLCGLTLPFSLHPTVIVSLSSNCINLLHPWGWNSDCTLCLNEYLKLKWNGDCGWLSMVWKHRLDWILNISCSTKEEIVE